MSKSVDELTLNDIGNSIVEHGGIMEDIYLLIKKIDWNNPEYEINEAFNKLILIPDDDLSLLIMPMMDKMCWYNSARVLKEIGFPRVKNVIPELLVWLQDMNWPGAEIIAELLLSADNGVIKHVKEILLTDDDIWKYWVLERLVAKWNKEWIKQLEPELLNLTQKNDDEGVNELAINILNKLK